MNEQLIQERFKLGRQRNTAIDILRIVACILVFFCHTWIVSTSEFGLVLKPNLEMFLQTPAWAGVWIFMAISGFFAGVHWNTKQFSKGHVFEYFRSRLVKILLPTYGFIFLVYVLHEPIQLTKVNIILRFLTITFNGGSGCGRGIGATWYVFTLMWLYMLAPLIHYIYERWISGKIKNIYTLSLVVLILGGGFRVLSYFLKMDWYTVVYTSPIGNLDLFLIGFIASKDIKHSLPGGGQILSKRKAVVMVFGLVLVSTNCVMYYFGGYEVDGTMPYSFFMALYMYVLPSAYGLWLMMFFCAFKDTVSKNARFGECVGKIADRTFHFYLWHTLILYNMAELIEMNTPLISHITLLFVGFIATSIVAEIHYAAWNNISGKLLKRT